MKQVPNVCAIVAALQYCRACNSQTGPGSMGAISAKEKAARNGWASSDLVMNLHVPTLYTTVVLTLGSIDVPVSAQSSPTTYPSYVVDAQIPITSSDGFNNPRGLAVTPGGIVYVADSGNHRVLQFSPDGVQTTVSFGTLSPAVDNPTGVALDGSGNLYVLDTATNRLVKLPVGKTNGLAIIRSPVLDQPIAVAADALGNLAIVNAGNATITTRRAGGTPFVFNTGATVLISPQAVTFDDQGVLYVADSGNGSIPPAVYRFPKFGGTGTNLTPAGYSLSSLDGVSVDTLKNLYLLDATDNQLIEVPANGNAAFLIPQSNFRKPSGLAIDNIGNFYVSDDGDSSTVTELIYRNAANFGSLAVGAHSSPVTFNYSFYEPTTVTAIHGVGGGLLNSEYLQAPGGTCALTLYAPMNSAMGATPATCTVKFRFQPKYPGGRPGAVELSTSNGTATQATNGIGLGSQLGLLPPLISKIKLPAGERTGIIAVNAAETEIYFPGSGGIYALPLGGGQPMLIPNTTGLGGRGLVVNGAGDLLVVSGPPFEIITFPRDGSAASIRKIPELSDPQAIAIDPNGILYITDYGTVNRNNVVDGYVLRITPAGAVTKVNPNYYLFPTQIATDSYGNVYVADWGTRQVTKILAGTLTQTSLNVEDSGLTGQNLTNLTVDASGTVYFFDEFVGNYDPYQGGVVALLPSGILQDLPIPIPYPYNLPFDPLNPNSMVAAPSGKIYIASGDIYVLNRRQGLLHFPTPASESPFPVSVYNIGNQNLVENNPNKLFTETGSGAGSFQFGAPSSLNFGQQACTPGIVLMPGDTCAFSATFTPQGPGSVTDLLHFSTNAVNSGSAIFKLIGVSPQ
jgi:sugar lactone lactonase YvrE